jgi:hypothetical protein
MKIRTKLLLALGAISLLPPIAAYVALIGNPRITFALRMNEYQAQQGLTARPGRSTGPVPPPIFPAFGKCTTLVWQQKPEQEQWLEVREGACPILAQSLPAFWACHHAVRLVE